MKYFLTLLLLCSYCNTISSQKQGSTWVMGYKDGINDTNNICGKIEVRFLDNQEPQSKCSYNNNILSMDGNQLTMSDDLGELLFYFDGYRIADKNHKIIENGDGINSGNVRDLYPDSYPVSNGCVILPDPIDKNKWHILHQYLEYFKNSPLGSGIFCTNILHTVIVRDSIDDKLKVTSKNNRLLINLLKFIALGHFNATKHANGKDWWILAQEKESGNHIEFLLTGRGIYPPGGTTSGLDPSDRDYNSNAVFSKDGSIYASCFVKDFIQIHDFDRCTGYLSNSRRIYNEEIHANGLGYIEISPNNRYLYACSFYKVWQYDLMSNDIQSSVKVVGIWDTMYYNKFFSTAFYTIARAPDDRIYISCFSSNVYLHRINYPNRLGDSCEFKLRAVTLPEYYVDLPQSTNFNLGPLKGSTCDSLSITKDNSTNEFYVYPVPAQDYVIFNFGDNTEDVILTIYNTSGIEIIKKKISTHSNSYQLDVLLLENGTYLYSLITSKFLNKNGKFIIIK